MRENYDKRDKMLVKLNKRVFVDMDNVLVDFQSGLDLQSEKVLKGYERRLDKISGLFVNMKLIEGSIEAMHEL